MDELRKKIWNEAVRDAIGTFFSKHPDLAVPLTIECLGMKEATPIGESGQLNSLPRFLVPDVGAVFAIVGCYHGDLAEGEKVLKPLRSFGRPSGDLFGVLSYVQMQSMFDPFFPPGRLTYVKSNFMHSLTDQAIETTAAYVGTGPSPYSFAPGIEHWHGAATRVGVSETAFPHRQNSFNFIIWSNWEGADNSEKNIQWTRDYWSAMKPFLKTGSYGNYVSDEGEAVAREAYGANFDRLVTLKNKYDPTNLFCMNHNIKPTLQPAASRTKPIDLGATNAAVS